MEQDRTLLPLWHYANWNYQSTIPAVGHEL